jgi:hypothetical protein
MRLVDRIKEKRLGGFDFSKFISTRPLSFKVSLLGIDSEKVEYVMVRNGEFSRVIFQTARNLSEWERQGCWIKIHPTSFENNPVLEFGEVIKFMDSLPLEISEEEDTYVFLMKVYYRTVQEIKKKTSK